MDYKIKYIDHIPDLNTTNIICIRSGETHSKTIENLLAAVEMHKQNKISKDSQYFILIYHLPINLYEACLIKQKNCNQNHNDPEKRSKPY